VISEVGLLVLLKVPGCDTCSRRGQALDGLGLCHAREALVHIDYHPTTEISDPADPMISCVYQLRVSR